MGAVWGSGSPYADSYLPATICKRAFYFGKMECNGFVFSYNNDQFRRTEYPAKAGDTLDWKRNGQRGSVKSTVIGFSAQKPDSVLVMVGDKKRWIKKSNVLRVIPAL